MDTMSFYEFRSEKAGVTFSRKTKSCHSQTCFNNVLRIYLNEKVNFVWNAVVTSGLVPLVAT